MRFAVRFGITLLRLLTRAGGLESTGTITTGGALDLNSVTAALSQAEQEVFFLALTNLTTAGIAEELKITESGVRFHLGNIFRKTKTKSRVQLLSSFVDPTRVDRNILLYVYQLKKEIDELKFKMEKVLPSGIHANQI